MSHGIGRSGRVSGAHREGRASVGLIALSLLVALGLAAVEYGALRVRRARAPLVLSPARAGDAAATAPATAADAPAQVRPHEPEGGVFVEASPAARGARVRSHGGESPLAQGAPDRPTDSVSGRSALASNDTLRRTDAGAAVDADAIAAPKGPPARGSVGDAAPVSLDPLRRRCYGGRGDPLDEAAIRFHAARIGPAMLARDAALVARLYRRLLVGGAPELPHLPGLVLALEGVGEADAAAACAALLERLVAEATGPPSP